MEIGIWRNNFGFVGLLYLLNEELEEVNGRAGRLSTAKQEIVKWDDIINGIINFLFFELFPHFLDIIFLLIFPELELKDLTKDIEGLSEYRSEVLEEIQEKLEEKEKVVYDILQQTAD